MNLLVLGDFYYGYEYIADDIYEMAEYIKKNNYSLIVNLEGPITDAKAKLLPNKRGERLKQSSKVVDVLKTLNVCGVTLANNHIFDYGMQGLIDTISILDQNNIKHTGAGENLSQACNPMIIDVTEKSYAFYGMSDGYEEAVLASIDQPGCAPIELENVHFCDNMTNIAFLHTGFEFNTLPMPRNIKESKYLIDSGFTYVFSSHPHVVQPYQNYRDCEIYYSLGNFYFSNFRKEFSDKKIKGKGTGYANIGYGIGITQNMNYHYKIEYVSSENKSKIYTDKIEELEGDRITSFEYFLDCFHSRNNYNPILTGFTMIDKPLLLSLNIAYKVYSLIKKMK